MKKIFLLLVIIITNQTFSQNSEIIGSGTSASNMYGGVQVSAGSNSGVWIKSSSSKAKVEGSYYLFSNWGNIGSFYLIGNEGYKVPKVNFNVRFNRFEANMGNDGSKDSIFAFNSQSIKKVILGSKVFVKKQVAGKGSNYFLELIQEGDKVSLLKSYNAVISPGTVNPMTQQKMKADKIDIKTSYFVDRNGELEEIKLKKSTILKLMSDKKDEIKSFLNEHSLSFKKDPDIKEIFNYYNSII
ncbi:hypothetical protein [uncultured Algibacter sp.]|uniref:hypothetical protein n=1 Tax=uncultured Algibacter sp. TaxID=298659 RepID=UPI00262A3F5B|nr:hypothetical protein [uncultured Algibacter sp.]